MTASNLPTMTGVKSSNLEAVGYDEPSRTMHVRFKNGGLYKYSDVAPHTHQAFVTADSVGKHFAKNIAGKYIHSKVQG